MRILRSHVHVRHQLFPERQAALLADARSYERTEWVSLGCKLASEDVQDALARRVDEPCVVRHLQVTMSADAKAYVTCVLVMSLWLVISPALPPSSESTLPTGI